MMEQNASVDLSPTLTRILGAVAVASVLITTIYVANFSPVASEISARWNVHSRAVTQYRLDRLAAFKATWKDKCALTPAGKIGYPLASNFNRFLPPRSLDLDFKDGTKTFYDLNDLKTVDCPHNPNS
jgi:hypothetical protein